MIILQGKHNQAKVFADQIEEKAVAQLIELCNQEFTKGASIAVMPDVHAGKGCTIGTTMTIQDKVVPNLVGVDIGCGMHVSKLEEKDVDLERLDRIVHEKIPSGYEIRNKAHPYEEHINFAGLKSRRHIDMDRAKRSLGTLGGGNHFIELNRDKDGNLYLVIHSGSRYLGKQVAEYYQEVAYKELMNLKNKKETLIQELKAQGREKEIQTELKKLQPAKVNKELAYLEGESFRDYIHDMRITQMYAEINRKAMADEIIKAMGLTLVEEFTTIHNYIDTVNMILRKGAISARKGEKVIIPMNMRDGSLIAIGKGNPDWNYSAPHGAGRLFSRSASREKISLQEFQEAMKGIYSTSVCETTIDESPFAYKPMEEIIANTKDTLDIVDVIRPLYNFKAH
ncbi:RNA-splicing ligase RtcB [Thermicanus aegyptius]|uniref:RNA-splicing ligase RtcB n=1 Tax=Thermicanus aegyptius TaxID=94009 RepID=UPI0004034607|nr:RNA-splicing ligase RtcB [Thermicanus aegyptius]